ncbi:hypothetical protein LTS18_004161, partial [Coniosporium uncinatum]
MLQTSHTSQPGPVYHRDTPGALILPRLPPHAPHAKGVLDHHGPRHDEQVKYVAPQRSYSVDSTGQRPSTAGPHQNSLETRQRPPASAGGQGPPPPAAQMDHGPPQQAYPGMEHHPNGVMHAGPNGMPIHPQHGQYMAMPVDQGYNAAYAPSTGYGPGPNNPGYQMRRKQVRAQQVCH